MIRLKILRSQFSRVIGLQLARFSSPCFFLGIKIHLDCIHEIGAHFPMRRMSLNILVIGKTKVSEKCLKNSEGMPSGPGALPLGDELMASATSSCEIGRLRVCCWVGVRVGQCQGKESACLTSLRSHCFCKCSLQATALPWGSVILLPSTSRSGILAN